ncbi:MAG: aldose epimerase family protein [Chitinophagaceae bacterium]
MKKMNDETALISTAHIVIRDCEESNAIQMADMRAGNMRVLLTTMGCSVMQVIVPDRSGNKRNVVAGYADAGAYAQNPHYLGCTIGRYANRIAGGRFERGGKAYHLPVNEDSHLLHGGNNGFHQKNWRITVVSEGEEQCEITMETYSPDGEEGFPGNLTASVKYMLHANGRLEIRYRAISDKDTPINFTNHTYFNLSGFREPTIYGHRLQIFADAHTEKSPANVPTGRIVPNAGTPLDFSMPKYLEKDIHALEKDNGYDHNFVLRQYNASVPEPAAVVYEPTGGISLKVYTDRPGIQLYTANAWAGKESGAHALPYGKHGALALETQAFPDSVNHPAFPDTWLKAGVEFNSTTIFEFGTEDPF